MNLGNIIFQWDFLSYLDFILCILCLFILVPFIYIIYLNNHKISEKNQSLCFEGEIDTNQINELIEHVDSLEIRFSKKFSKFRNLLTAFGHDPSEDKRMHVEVIESILFCIQLNGQNRWKVFWKYSDMFLKIMVLVLPITVVIVACVSYLSFQLPGLVVSFIAGIFIIPFSLNILSSFLKISQHVIRKKGKNIPALNLAYFSLEAIINRNVERAYDKETQSYYYYTTIQKYNNLVNSKAGFSSVYVRTSSSITGELQELAIGEKMK